MATTRIPFCEKIEFYCWDQKRSAEAAELGPESLALRADEPLRPGALVTLRLKLPGQLAFTVLGRVAGPPESDLTSSLVDIDFVDISPSDRARIAAYASA